MVEELQQKPAYKAWYTLARSLVVGYVEGENTKVAYGPWAQTVKYNATEGLHVGVGFRTTKFLHPDIRFSAQLGYGFRDHLLKGGGSVEYMMRRDVTRKLTLSGSYDYQQLGQGSSGLTQQGLFSTLLSGRTGDKQTLMRDLEMQYEHEFSPTFSAYFSLESKRLFGNGLVPLYTRDSVFVKSISINQFRVIGRFAWEERINRGHFSKAHIFTRYPIIMFDLAYGIQGLRSNVHAGSYFRGEMSFDWHIPAGMMGFGSIHLDGGAILGEVPYPFLKLHAGNPLMLLDKTAFSCMDYYEFASDRWGTLMYEHNLNGLILGRIPLIKYLDLREIITVKAAIGTLSDANRRGTILPIEGLASLEKPYVEAGVGLSNLFRVIRMDAVWRLTNRRPDSRNFQVTLGFDVQF